MSTAKVDLNCDVGEGFGSWTMGPDAELMQLVTSANVACGFHAGDPSWMRRTCELAAQCGVTVGAQVGYPDLVGFGRRHLEMAPAELTDAVLYQIGALDGFARAAGTPVRYVKPHGALYHAAAERPDYALAVVTAVRQFDRALAVVAPPRSQLAQAAAEAGLTAVVEGFADRGYAADGRLLARSLPGAVLTDPEAVGRQAVALATGADESPAGGPIATLCVHSDTPGAAAVAQAARSALEQAGIAVVPFAGGISR
jgi:UPF0271 protein